MRGVIQRDPLRRYPRRGNRRLGLPLFLLGALLVSAVAVAVSDPPAVAESEGAPGAPPAYEALASGAAHACAIATNGEVKCWGNNTNGRLGLGDTANRGDAAGEMGDNLPAVDLGTGRTAVAVTAGNSHTCAILDNGSVKCWGNNAQGRLGLGDTNARGDAAGEMGDNLPAVDLGTGRTAVAISAGNSHTCAVLDNAQAKCWGNNTSGQLGLNDTNARGDAAGEMGNSLPQIHLATFQSVVSISVGNGYTCALLGDGRIKCWGNNNVGQLGQGNTTQRGDQFGEMGDNLLAVDLGLGRTATAVATGDAHSCAILDDRSLKCWGSNNGGRLGLGDTANRGDGAGELGDNLPAVDVGAPRVVTGISLGETHTCARLSTLTIKCWGLNGSGQLGAADTTTRGDGPGEMGNALVTAALGAGRSPIAVSAGGQSTCARLDDSTVKCWGENAAGQLGLGNTGDRGDGAGEMGDNLPAVDRAVRRTVVDLDLGGRSGCATFDQALLKCWGNGTVGELGTGANQSLGDAGDEMGDDLGYVSLGSGRTVSSVSVGSQHACAVLDDGSVRCWGEGANGRLGVGDTASRGDGAGEMGDNLLPVDLGSGRTATAVTAGGAHTCALLDNGSVKCWGSGLSGALGLGDSVSRGDGPNEMGDNLPAVNLGTGRTATTVVAGFRRTCAILDNAALKCWGSSTSGALGLGDFVSRGDGPNEMGDNLPAVNLGAGRTAVEVRLGFQHACALLDNSTVKCWGFNGNGQLGLGDTLARGDGPNEMGDNLPAVTLGTGRTVSSLALDMASAHTCAILDNDTLKCWGVNGNGQLGLGDVGNRGGNVADMGDNLPAVSLGSGRVAVEVATGNDFTCARLDDDAVKCWGDNLSGQLGLGDTDQRGDGAGEMGNSLARVELGGDAPVGISGSVTIANSNQSFGGAFVAVLATTDFSLVGGVVADLGGAFVAELPPGAYFLYAIDPSGRRSPGFFGPPTTVTVAGLGLTDADPALPPLRGEISGTITDQTSGTPLADAWAVALTAGGAPEAADATNPSGQFSIPDLAAGSHFLAYLDATGARATEFFSNSPNVPDATLVNVIAGSGGSRNASLAAQTPTGTGAALTGTVTATGSGAPLANVLVIAMHASDFRLARADATNNAGQYSLDVAAGSYKLVFLDATARRAMEWHDNEPYFGLADAASVNAPAVTNAVLDSATGTVSGFVTDGSAHRPGIWVLAIGPTGAIAGGTITAGEGYTLEGLPPGSYRITFVDPSGELAQKYFNNSSTYGSATLVNVSAGTATTDINAMLSPS